MTRSFPAGLVISLACFTFSATGCRQDVGDGIPLALLSLADPPGPAHIFLGPGTTGQRGGAAGMDSLCMTSSLRQTGTYKAFVTDSTRRACSTANCSGGSSENLNWVLTPGRQYYRLANSVQTTVGTANASGIFDFPLSASLNTGTSPLWTGLNANWTNDTTNNCSNWNSTAGNGANGDGGSTSSAAINNGTTACSSTITYICVQQ